MKKLTALTLPIASFLLASPAFAAVNSITIDPCADAGGQKFNLLCALGTGNIGDLIKAVITLLFVVAILVALFFLIYGGIKWITSGGDKAGVEGARNMIVAALVGLVIVFLSYFIINFVLNFFGQGSINSLIIPSLSL